MISDTLLTFSDRQALTVSAGSSNVIDLSAQPRLDRPMWLAFVLHQIAGAGVYEIQIQTADDASFTSPRVMQSIRPAPEDAHANAVLGVPMPYGIQRYVRIYYALSGTTPSLNVTAYLTSQHPTYWKPMHSASST
ncbi:Bbp16 family capsid cement protein [Caballeronia sp. GAFFF2]|uniref:Bbp16 family capsid cement protein n=1 Tax=Caballeronia sp. GAFFF2 TaxID=2921741 RepID=UPI002028CDD1|nr:hypothetical protein [Caballeronia sp. GAFFF2]